MTRRLRIRSTHAPAGSPTSRNAAVSAAVRKPTCELGGAEHGDGEHRDGQQRELGAELADGVAAPQPEEVAVAQQRPFALQGSRDPSPQSRPSDWEMSITARRLAVHASPVTRMPKRSPAAAHSPRRCGCASCGSACTKRGPTASSPTRSGSTPAACCTMCARWWRPGSCGPRSRGAASAGAREVPYRATGLSWTTPRRRPAPTSCSTRSCRRSRGWARMRSSPPASGLKLTPEHREELLDRFQALFQEYIDRGPDPDGAPISLFFAEHPDRQQPCRTQSTPRRAARPNGVRGGVSRRRAGGPRPRTPRGRRSARRGTRGGRPPTGRPGTPTSATVPMPILIGHGQSCRVTKPSMMPEISRARSRSRSTIVKNARPSSASACRARARPGRDPRPEDQHAGRAARKIEYSSSWPCGAM